MTDPLAARQEIEQARRELAGLIEVIAARLDVPAQAERYARELRERGISRAEQAYTQVRAATPQPVLEAVDRLAGALAPSVASAREYVAKLDRQQRKRAALGACGAVFVLIVLRRSRRR